MLVFIKGDFNIKENYSQLWKSSNKVSLEGIGSSTWWVEHVPESAGWYGYLHKPFWACNMEATYLCNVVTFLQILRPNGNKYFLRNCHQCVTYLYSVSKPLESMAIRRGLGTGYKVDCILSEILKNIILSYYCCSGGIHCEIYKSSCNISCLNSSPLSFSFISSPSFLE
jgi:hypothetical protein